MPNDDVLTVVAIGTWLYDGTVPRRIELLSKPAAMAYSRWIEDQQSGEFIIDEPLQFHRHKTACSIKWERRGAASFLV